MSRMASGLRKGGLVVTAGVVAAVGIVGAAGAAPVASPTPDPAVSSTAGGGVDLFYTALDRTVVTRHKQGTGGWSPAESLGGTLISGPAAITIGGLDPVSYVVGVGTDNALWSRTRPGGAGGWQPWRRVGGFTYDAPAISCTGADSHPVVYVRGKDNRLWRKNLLAGGWEALGGRLLSGPAAVPATNGECPAAQDVFALGGDLAVYEYRGGTWHSLGGRSGPAPSAVRLAGGRTEVFVLGRDRALWTASRDSDGASWSQWRRIGGRFRSGPAAQVTGTSTRLVVALAENGTYYQARSTDGSTWTLTAVNG